MGTSKNRGPTNGRYLARGENGAKVCTRCQQHRALASFVVDRSRHDGRGYVCADCRALARTAPGPTIRERRLHAAAGLAWCRGCRTWRSDPVRAGLCRGCANQDARTRYGTDPEFRARRSRRAASRRRGVDPVPVGAAALIMEAFEGRCAYCDQPGATWDHVVPVSQGGLTEPANVVPACASCNSSKRTRDVWEWLAEKGREPSAALFDRLSLADVSLFPPRGPSAL